MAGNQNSGGMRPTAPQNNPANVNPMGGDGQSGQPNPNYTGFGYGQTGEINNTADAASMYKAPTSRTPSTPTVKSSLLSMSALNELEPTGKYISDGIQFGRGAGSEALPPSVNPDRRTIENADLIAKYLPDLINATRVQNAPDSYKRLINKLKGMI